MKIERVSVQAYPSLAERLRAAEKVVEAARQVMGGGLHRCYLSGTGDKLNAEACPGCTERFDLQRSLEAYDKLAKGGKP